MKKGFTLIELLAVIVILAVIALIATPAVLNIIEDSKQSAAEASARNIVSSAETYYLKELMNNNKVSSIDLSTNTLKYDGDKAEKGYVNLDKEGKGSGKMYISGYCIEVTSKSELTSEKVDADDCDVTSITPPVEKASVVVEYETVKSLGGLSQIRYDIKLNNNIVSEAYITIKITTDKVYKEDYIVNEKVTCDSTTGVCSSSKNYYMPKLDNFTFDFEITIGDKTYTASKEYIQKEGYVLTGKIIIDITTNY